METKHTPGKWTLTIDDRIEAFYLSKNNKEVKRNDATHHTTKTICKMELPFLQNTLNEEQKANAKLIAAAPDLLAITQMFVDYLDSNLSEAELILKNKAIESIKKATE